MTDFIVKIIRIITKIFRINISDNIEETLVQFVKFGIVGVTNTVISYIINIVTLLTIQPLQVSWDYLVANLIAFLLGTLWSFIWNSKFVFKVGEGRERNFFISLMKSYASYAFTGIILNNIFSYFWINILSISKYISPLLNLVISVPINFIINKLWAFRTNVSNSE